MTRLARIRAYVKNLGWKGIDSEDAEWLLETVDLLAKAAKAYEQEVMANLRAASSRVPGPPEPPRWAAKAFLESALARLEEPDA